MPIGSHLSEIPLIGKIRFLLYQSISGKSVLSIYLLLFALFQAGLNVGNGAGWTDILPRDMPVNQLNMYQSSDTRGRYVFQVSTNPPVQAGCSTNPNLGR